MVSLINKYSRILLDMITNKIIWLDYVIMILNLYDKNNF